MNDLQAARSAGRGVATRLLLNAAMLLLSLVLARLALSRLFLLNLPDLLSIWGFTTAGVVGLFTSLLPKRTRLAMLAAVQRTVGSRRATWVAAGLLVASAGACSIVRYDVRWIGGETLEVVLNDRPRTLRAAKTESGYHTAHVLRFLPQRFDLRVNSFVAQGRPRMFANQTINVPPSATGQGEGSFPSAERALLAAFFQLFEQQEVERGQRLIDTIEPATDADRARLRRLQMLHAAVSAIFVANAPDLAQVRAGDLARDYEQDLWSVLLLAGSRYAARDYEGCARHLGDDFLGNAQRAPLREIYVTGRFFRGVCLLRAASATVGPRKPRLFQAAERDFAMSEAAARAVTDEAFRDLALPASIVFNGISRFYRGEFDAAVSTFSRAFDVGRPDWRARAYNGAGYVRFVQGNMAEASRYLNDALMILPNFPYARSNYGFILMRDRNRYNDARRFFLANVMDPVLQRTSRRDVILGKLSLAHLAEVQGGPLSGIIQGYADLSREIQGNTWDGIMPEELRYAYLARELVQRIYFSGQYYAVEVFALTFLCRAKARIAPLVAQSNRDAIELSTQLDVQIANLERTVHPAWLQHPGDGWFSALQSCRS